MEMEYKDPNRRGRYIVILGVVLALVAGGAAYYTINQAQQQAGHGGLQTVTIVVALKEIPARKPIEKADVGTRDVPIDDTNAQGVFSDASKVIGLVPSVRILAGQPVYANLLGTGSQGGTLVILDPGEVVTPTSEAWRAVSMTVPDDRAVGGLLKAGDTVDVFVTLSVLVPQSLIEAGKFYSDRSTKITYQNLTVLAKATSFYVVKVPENLAEEISHLQASGAASFSFALRPAGRHPDRRRLEVRRDHEHHHPALRPADPGGLPDRWRRRGPAGLDARAVSLPGSGRLRLARPQSVARLRTWRPAWARSESRCAPTGAFGISPCAPESAPDFRGGPLHADLSTTARPGHGQDRRQAVQCPSARRWTLRSAGSRHNDPWAASDLRHPFRLAEPTSRPGGSTRASASASVPDVSISTTSRRSASTRSFIPAWAAIRRSASAGSMPRPVRRTRWSSQATHHTSSHRSARPPSTSLIASMATAGACRSRGGLDRRRRSAAGRAGWTIASRSGARPGRRTRSRRGPPGRASRRRRATASDRSGPARRRAGLAGQR